MADNTKRLIGISEHALKVCLDNVKSMMKFVPSHEYEKHFLLVQQFESLIHNGTKFTAPVDFVKDNASDLSNKVVDLSNKVGDSVVDVANGVDKGIKDTSKKISDTIKNIFRF